MPPKGLCGASFETERLIVGDEFIECRVPLGIFVSLEGEHVAERNAPVRAEPTIRDLAVVEQLDQRGLEMLSKSPACWVVSSTG